MTETHVEPAEPIPISLVAHYAFCPRRAWLETMGERTDTYQMAVGTREHATADDPTASRGHRVRSVDVISHELGVVGRCDTVEVDEAGGMTVLEYKATPIRRRPEVTEPMRVQLALQVAALREMGLPVVGQAVYFTQHRTRVPVQIGRSDVDAARRLVRATAAIVASPAAPPPLEDDPRCMRCSHVGVCLPDERALAEVRRRIVVADPDTQVLHLATPGSRASVRTGRIEVRRQDEKLGTIPIERVQGVVVHGNVDLSGGLIRELLWRSLPVVWCSSSGRVTGWAVSAHSPNGGPRLRQHVAAASGRLDVARQFVAAKITNQATLLRRHGDAPDTVTRLRRLQRDALIAPSLTSLFVAIQLV